MAKDDDGVQLFGKCNICVVCLKDLDLGTANEVGKLSGSWTFFNLKSHTR
jgi:hypothetical protein